MDNKKKYTLNVQFATNEKVDGDILWETIKEALLSYTKRTRSGLDVFEAFVEEMKYEKPTY